MPAGSESTEIHRARRFVWPLRAGDPVESIAVMAIFVIIIAVAGAAYDMPTVLARFGAIEVLSLAKEREVCTHEAWAVTGEFATSSFCAPRDPRPGRYSTLVEAPAAEPAMAYSIATSVDPAGERRLGIWPAVGPGESPATLSWHCGPSAVPPGLKRVGTDVTTVQSRDLPSPCRGAGSHAPPR